MASEQKRGAGCDEGDGCQISRSGNGGRGLPEHYTIVGVDISAADIKARYKGTKREAYICAIIDEAVQKQRTSKPPTPARVEMMRRTIIVQPIACVDLGRDGTEDGWEKDARGRKVKAGLRHVLVYDGRQRSMNLRAVNADPQGMPPRILTCNFVTFSGKSAAKEAALFKVGANASLRRTPSSLAEDAADMVRQGYNKIDVAPYVERDTVAEVELLLDLDLCEPEVKEAFDDGRLALSRAPDYAKKHPTEQARMLARETAAVKGDRSKSAEAARNGAAPPRLKARTPTQRAKLIEYLQGNADADAAAVKQGGAPVAMFSALDLHAYTRWQGGDNDALSDKGVSDELRALCAAAWGKP